MFCFVLFYHLTEPEQCKWRGSVPESEFRLWRPGRPWVNSAAQNNPQCKLWNV